MRKLIATLAAVVLFSTAAHGQTICGARKEILQQLSQKYKETPVAIGVTTEGALIELVASHGGDTWTIIRSTPDGQSCFMIAGEGWRVLPEINTDPEA